MTLRGRLIVWGVTRTHAPLHMTVELVLGFPVTAAPPHAEAYPPSGRMVP